MRGVDIVGSGCTTAVMMTTDINVCVCNPNTETDQTGHKFTCYLIVIQTENIAFSLHESRIRRRYSEFAWLRKRLSSVHADISTPSLPPKTLFSSRFDAGLIGDRKQGLQDFINRVVSETRYLADSAVHLFLQSHLSVAEIEDVISGSSGCSASDCIMASAQEQRDDHAASRPNPPDTLPSLHGNQSGFPNTSPHSIFSPTRPRSIVNEDKFTFPGSFGSFTEDETSGMGSRSHTAGVSAATTTQAVIEATPTGGAKESEVQASAPKEDSCPSLKENTYGEMAQLAKHGRPV